MAVAAAVVFLALVALALLAPLIAPYDPLNQDLEHTFQGPSLAHWLGTDSLGRDVLSRLLFGARQSIPAAALATCFALVLGIPLGLVTGYFGRWIDRIGSIATDALMTFPGVILAIALVAVFGNTLTNAMLALGLVFSPSFVRLSRAETIANRNEDYVTAGALLGFSQVRILFRHILPNIVPPLIVQVFLTFSFALLAQSGLAFIGVGTHPPEPAWGAMLADSITFMSIYPFLVVPAGLAITLTALSASIVGDGLRDSLGTGVSARRRRRSVEVVTKPAYGGVMTVRDLTVGFDGPNGWTTILDGVNLDVEAGRTTGVVGESGSGKSVTALAILGLLPPPLQVVAGSIRLGGRELLGLPERALQPLRGRDIAMIFQDPVGALNPTLTVGHQMVETIRLYRPMSKSQARDEAVRLLRLVEIAEPELRLGAYPHEFSGGMAQRVMIAMAIAGSPKVLIADEPTTALDVTVQIEILDLLRRLQREKGMAMVFITHDLGVVADICDDAVVLLQGRVVEAAKVDDLFSHPEDEYTQQLLEASRRSGHGQEAS